MYRYEWASIDGTWVITTIARTSINHLLFPLMITCIYSYHMFFKGKLKEQSVKHMKSIRKIKAPYLILYVQHVHV